MITGPVFESNPPTIGEGRVRVPRYLFKLVYDATTGRSWAHWQENREGETVGRPISYQEVVKRTGVEFLPRTHWTIDAPQAPLARERTSIR